MEKKKLINDYLDVSEKIKNDLIEFRKSLVTSVLDKKLSKEEIATMDRQVEEINNLFSSINGWMFLNRDFVVSEESTSIMKLLDPRDKLWNRNYILMNFIFLPEQKEKYILVQHRYKKEVIVDEGGIMDKTQQMQIRYLIYRLLYTESDVCMSEIVLEEFTGPGSYYEALANLIKIVHEKLMSENDNEVLENPSYEAI